MSEISRDDTNDMAHLEDVESVSSCSDISNMEEPPIRGDPIHEGLLQNDAENNNVDASDQKSFKTSTTLVEDTNESDAQGEPAFPSITSHMLADLLLALPAVCFMIYGILASHYDGEPKESRAAAILQAAAKYGPSVFPIIFAAIATNLLKSIGAWKLERGITVLNLEFLLRSRTVFSAFASPVSLRMVTISNLLIVLLWTISPLGGQAALRVIGEGRAEYDWNFSYLDISGMAKNTEYIAYQSSDSYKTSQARIAFAAAISAPQQIKKGKQDLFGHVKIPMVEPYNLSGTLAKDGWYNPDDTHLAPKTIYSSLVGLPIFPSGGFDQGSKYQFRLNTSYINTRCTLENSTGIHQLNWSNYLSYRTNSSHASELGTSPYNDENALLIEDVWGVRRRTGPRTLIFTLYDNTQSIITNATCKLRTTYVELKVACESAVCNTTAIRQVPNKENENQTVLDKEVAGNFLAGDFLTTFLDPKLSSTGSAPIPGYLMSPMSPFDPPSGGSVYGSGPEAFSQRFAQLLNSRWVIRCAPSNALNNLQSITDSTGGIVYQEAMGMKTVGTPLLKVNWAWLGVLVVSSMIMLLAALVAAILNALRRGPNILDHTIRLTRDSPYLGIASSGSSMEHGDDFTRRLKHVKICLGDVRADEKLGYIAIGSMDQTVPLSRQGCERRYK